VHQVGIKRRLSLCYGAWSTKRKNYRRLYACIEDKNEKGPQSERTVNIRLGYHLFRNQELMSDSTPHFRYITHKYRTGCVKGEDRTVDPCYCARRTSPVCTHIGPALPGNSGTRRPEISHSCLEMAEWKEETELSQLTLKSFNRFLL